MPLGERPLQAPPTYAEQGDPPADGGLLIENSGERFARAKEFRSLVAQRTEVLVDGSSGRPAPAGVVFEALELSRFGVELISLLESESLRGSRHAMKKISSRRREP